MLLAIPRGSGFGLFATVISLSSCRIEWLTALSLNQRSCSEVFGAVGAAEGWVELEHHWHQRINPKGRYFAAEVVAVAVAVKVDCNLELSNGMD